MAQQSVAQRVNALPDEMSGGELLALFSALQKDVNFLRSQSLASAGLVISATTTKVKTGASDWYGLANGTLVKIASGTDQAVLAGSVTNAKFNVFVFSVDSAGTKYTTMGVEGASLATITFPTLADGQAPLGFVIINPTGTGPFVGGTTPCGACSATAPSSRTLSTSMRTARSTRPSIPSLKEKQMAYNLNNAIEGGSITLTTAGITGLSGAAATYSTGATAMSFMVDGKFLTKAQVSGGSIAATDGNTAKAFKAQAASTVCAYLFSIDASGNHHMSQGPVVAYTDTTALSTVVPLPAVPGNDAPFAYAVIKNGSTGSAWTFGTSNWNATGITVDTPVNLCNIPAAVPLTA